MQGVAEKEIEKVKVKKREWHIATLEDVDREDVARVVSSINKTAGTHLLCKEYRTVNNVYCLYMEAAINEAGDTKDLLRKANLKLPKGAQLTIVA